MIRHGDSHYYSREDLTGKKTTTTTMAAVTFGNASLIINTPAKYDGMMCLAYRGTYLMNGMPKYRLVVVIWWSEV
jgi:hypothetical protein